MAFSPSLLLKNAYIHRWNAFRAPKRWGIDNEEIIRVICLLVVLENAILPRAVLTSSLGSSAQEPPKQQQPTVAGLKSLALKLTGKKRCTESNHSLAPRLHSL